MCRHGIKPIVAIVPDNGDPELMVSAPDDNFWEHMRALQAQGWAIGVHGFQHLPCCRGKSLIPVCATSEFVGLPEHAQREKIEAAVQIMRGHGLEPTVWVAPRHGLDRTTVRVVRSVGIEVISDGLARFPYTEDGMFWLPQQMWNVLPRSTGVWTLCFHTNGELASTYESLERFLDQSSEQFITIARARALYEHRKRSVGDRIFRFLWLQRRGMRGLVRRFV